MTISPGNIAIVKSRPIWSGDRAGVLIETLQKQLCCIVRWDHITFDNPGEVGNYLTNQVIADPGSVFGDNWLFGLATSIFPSSSMECSQNLDRHTPRRPSRSRPSPIPLTVPEVRR